MTGSNDYSTRFWSRARPGDSNFEQFLPKRVGVRLTRIEAHCEPLIVTIDTQKKMIFISFITYILIQYTYDIITLI